MRATGIMADGLRTRTLDTYGSGLALYHRYCDARGVAEHDRAPASADLILSFTSALAGHYSASTISNSLAGVRMWHLLHRLPWNSTLEHQQLLLRGATQLVAVHDVSCEPEQRISRPRRLPMTVRLLEAMSSQLDRSISLDVAVYACATTLLWAVARTGEFTAPSLTKFDPRIHITIEHVSQDILDRHGNVVTSFHLPRTKSSVTGEDVSWAEQVGAADPKSAFAAHLDLNKPQPGEHLFVHSVVRNGNLQRRPLTEKAFIARVQAALQAAGVHEKYTGHCFRIGGTLEYLLRGTPFAVVKVLGRWASDAFQLYLRQHAQILAPFLQANPGVWQQVQQLLGSELPDVR